MISRLLLLSIFILSCVKPQSEQEQSVAPKGLDTSIAQIVSKKKEKEEQVDTTLRAHRENAITRAVKKLSPAVVSVSVTELVKERDRLKMDLFYGLFVEPGQMREFNSLGTGFIVSEDGYVVTNQHVIGKNPSKVIVTLSNGDDYEAQVIGFDEYGDLALIKISGNAFPYVEFGDSDEIMVGEWAIAVGNPFGLFTDGQPSVTVGVVSATKRDFRPDPQQPRVYLDMIQTDAAINSGNSGGPLSNSLGQVIGVNTFIYTGGTSSGFVGLGFAIPSNTVLKIIRQLREKGQVSLDYDPGMEVMPITVEKAYQYQLPMIQGVFVYSVNKDGPAFDSGILPGDVLIKFNEERIYSYTHFQALLREYEAGDTIKVMILRKGRYYETDLKLMTKG
ncbi:trypsin-like serine protease [bacterium]|nr:MAG: trypsin-like serine protease [bacterium]